MQHEQILHGNTYGEGPVLGGQPRHCICINASRGLSATAELFVLVTFSAILTYKQGSVLQHISLTTAA